MQIFKNQDLEYWARQLICVGERQQELVAPGIPDIW